MFSFPPSLQSAPMPSYMSSAATQATQAPRPSTMPGSVPFRAGDWKCGSEGCGYHNFAKNVSCLRCGASRAQAALIADSSGGLSTPASMSSISSMYSTPSHHPSDSIGSSIFSSNQFPPSQSYPPPLPSGSMPSQSYPPLGGQSYGGPQGMGNNMGGMGMGSGGNKGPQIESGDWTCVSCGYSNFRRRNNCLRCNNFNPNLLSSQGSAGGMMGGPPQSMMRGQQQQQQHPQQQQQQHPQLSMLDTSIVDPFISDDSDKRDYPRVPQSAGPVPSTNYLTRSMNNLSLGPLTSHYGGAGGYGAIGGGPLTAPPGVSDDEYEFGSRSASAIDRLGGGFFSQRQRDD